MSGKTTNLQNIHSRINPQRRGELVSIKTAGECTLYFDFMYMELNETVKRINHQLRLPQVDEISVVGDNRTRLICRYFPVDSHELLLAVLPPP